MIGSGVLTRENYPAAPVFYSNRRVELIVSPNDALAYAAMYGSIDVVTDDAGAMDLSAHGGRVLASFERDKYVRVISTHP